MKTKNLFPVITITLVTLCFACKKSADKTLENPLVKDTVANITSFKLINANPQITINTNSINLTFPDTINDASNLIASFKLSPGAIANINGVEQQSGITKNDFGAPLTYVVKNSSGYSKTWTVTAFNNDYTKNWGLGYFLHQSMSNDRSYSWYVNQANTGVYSSINCAPSCATMAAKWCDSTFSLTVQQARDYYPNITGDWGLSTLANYLSNFNIKSQNLYLGDSEFAARDSIKKQLDLHNIVILALNSDAIRFYSGANKEARCDRYYSSLYGDHAVLAYGYEEVDRNFFVQVMDPWGYNYVYSNGTSKGIGRFYRIEDIYGGSKSQGKIALTVYHP